MSTKPEHTFFAAFERALDENPYLMLEICCSKATDWLVQIRDAEQVGYSAADKIVSTQAPTREAALTAAEKELMTVYPALIEVAPAAAQTQPVEQPQDSWPVLPSSEINKRFTETLTALEYAVRRKMAQHKRATVDLDEPVQVHLNARQEPVKAFALSLVQHVTADTLQLLCWTAEEYSGMRPPIIYTRRDVTRDVWFEALLDALGMLELIEAQK